MTARAAVVPGDRVRVHKNLHKGTWSVVDVKTGRVAADAERVVLADVEFRVQPGGLRRVRERGVREVHAYVVGELVSLDRPLPKRAAELKAFSYNPFKASTFYTCVGRVPVHTARQVRFDEKGAWFR